MKKSRILVIVTAVALAGVMSLPGCEVTVTECGNGECEEGETCVDCPEDCGACAVCGDGVCNGDETTATCPEDCPAGGAAVSFVWYIHGILGGEEGAYGVGSTTEICGMMEVTQIQLWIDNDGDSVTDQTFEFDDCSLGQGETTQEWESGDSLTFAFAAFNGATQISQSYEWATVTLAGGTNALGDVNFYVGDWGPLGVEMQWGDKIEEPGYGDCDWPPSSVTEMGYLLCYDGAACEGDYLYDEVDIDVNPADCAAQLDWDILDWATYTLIIDGEDDMAVTVWGYECPDLVVDSYEPNSNEFICQVLMTVSP